MKSGQKELIHDYLNLDRSTKRIKKRMEQKQIEFEAQSFCGGTIWNALGVRYKGFKIDDRVSDYIDLINTYEDNLEKNKRRSYYFNQFLNNLDPHTVASLKRRYRNTGYFEGIQELGHDEIVLEEILEIEEAISYQFPTIVVDELQREAMQVEHSTLAADTVEDSFQAMQKLLGV